MAISYRWLEAEAKNLGFSFIGATEVSRTPHTPAFISWIKNEDLGSMTFLKAPYVIQGRENPQHLLKDAKTMVIAGLQYQPQQSLGNPGDIYDEGVIVSYACYPDYHRKLENMFTELIKRIDAIAQETTRSRIFVDSGPVMEKDFAFKAGMGWIGRHSLFIHPQTGSFCVLGCLMTTVEIDKVKMNELTDICKSCSLCIESCPTGCINNNRTIRFSDCISYQTIENRGVVPKKLREKIGNHIFGCDICQNICPQNRNISTQENALDFQPIIKNTLPIKEGLTMTKNEFQKKYYATPVLRCSYEGFLRNLIIAAGNSKQKHNLPQLMGFLNNQSPILRVHAAWAIKMIADHETASELLNAKLACESDIRVKKEIRYLLAGDRTL